MTTVDAPIVSSEDPEALGSGRISNLASGPRGALRANWTHVTPELASKWLALNKSNRLVNPRRVKILADAIKQGRWHNTGDPIQFGNNQLFNGQHRLHAIVEAGEPVWLLVIHGLAEESRLALDTGRPRSFSDYLRMNQVADPAAVSAATRLLLEYDSGTLPSASFGLRDTHTLWNYYQENRGALEPALSVGNHVRKNVRVSRTCAAVAWVLFQRSSSVDCDGFFAEFSGDKLPERDGSPPYVLQRQFNTPGNDYIKTGGAAEKRLVIAMFLKAWKLYLEGADVKSFIYWRQGGARAEKFPALAKPAGPPTCPDHPDLTMSLSLVGNWICAGSDGNCRYGPQGD